MEPKQHQALLAIKGRPPGWATTVGDLAERLQIKHHSAVELSRRVEAKGWITRSRNRSDAREVFLALTARGDRILAKISRTHRQELSTAGPRLLRALRSAISRERRASGSLHSAGRFPRGAKKPKAIR